VLEQTNTNQTLITTTMNKFYAIHTPSNTVSKNPTYEYVPYGYISMADASTLESSMDGTQCRLIEYPTSAAYVSKMDTLEADWIEEVTSPE